MAIVECHRWMNTSIWEAAHQYLSSSPVGILSNRILNPVFFWVGNWPKELLHYRNMTEEQITAGSRRTPNPAYYRPFGPVITFLFLILETRAGAEGTIERPTVVWSADGTTLGSPLGSPIPTNVSEDAMFVLPSIIMDFWPSILNVATSKRMDNLHEYY